MSETTIKMSRDRNYVGRPGGGWEYEEILKLLIMKELMSDYRLQILNKKIKRTVDRYLKKVERVDEFGRKEIYTTNVQDKIHGVYKCWNNNGNLFIQCNYIRGKLHGLCKRWHNNGTMSYRYHYVQNKLHGSYTHWGRSGYFNYNKNYSNGLLMTPPP